MTFIFYVRGLLLILLMATGLGCSYDVQTIQPALLESGCDTSMITYSNTIKPILVQHCYTCHTDTSRNPERNLGGVHFDDFQTLRSYATQPYFGNPAYTYLQAKIRHIDQPGMPLSTEANPREPLSECNIRKIEMWIKQGANEN